MPDQIDVAAILAAPAEPPDSLHVTVAMLRVLQAEIATLQTQVALLRSLVPGS